MDDLTAQSTSQTSNQPARPSSREYLEQLRARRAGGKPSISPSTIPAPEPIQPTQASFVPPEAPFANLPTQQQSPSAQPAQPPQPAAAPTTPDFNATSRGTFPNESELFPGQYKPQPEEVILEWVAPSRPFKKRNRQFYTTVGLITVLISMILFFAGQFLPIAVVISVAFLGYVLSSVPPENVPITITTYGIRFDTVLYYWEELGRFWFDERYQQQMVQIETARFPGRLTILLGSVKPEEIEEILAEVLLKQKPQDTFVDRAAKWVQEKIPLES